MHTSLSAQASRSGSGSLSLTRPVKGRRAYRASFEVARQEPERYARMSAHASASLERFCSRKLAVERLRRFLDEAAQGDPSALQSIPA